MLWTILLGNDYNSISANRPGIDNSTSAVPAGLYQFEMGPRMKNKNILPWLFLKTIPRMDTIITVPIQVRMGIYKNTEWQVSFVNDYLTLGVLYGGINIFKGLENSIILTTSMTANNDSLTEYSAYVPISYSFQNGFSVWGQIGETIFNNDKLDPILSYSLAMGSTLGDKNGWFFEAYQSQTMGNKNLIENIPISVDWGITYLLENNVLLDISMGLTFQKNDSDYIETERFVEGGVSIRLPK